MPIGSVHTPHVERVDPDATAREAARRLRDGRVGMLVVVDRWRVLGVVTDRDLVLRVLAEDRDPAATPVREVMTAPATTVREDAPVEEAIAAMRRTGHRRLLVLDHDGTPCGVISADDVLRHLTAGLRGLGELVAGPSERLARRRDTPAARRTS